MDELLLENFYADDLDLMAVKGAVQVHFDICKDVTEKQGMKIVIAKKETSFYGVKKERLLLNCTGLCI